jgi:hypothetical protein
MYCGIHVYEKLDGMSAWLLGFIALRELLERWVVQWYFEDWEVLDRDNTRIWNSYYRPKPLFDHLPTWQDWLPEYRQLIIEVQDMVDEHTAQGTWKRPA